MEYFINYNLIILSKVINFTFYIPNAYCQLQGFGISKDCRWLGLLNFGVRAWRGKSLLIPNPCRYLNYSEQKLWNISSIHPDYTKQGHKLYFLHPQCLLPTTRIWDKQGLSLVGLVELRGPRLAEEILAYPQSL